MTQEQAMRRNDTIQASGETYMPPMAASAHALDHWLVYGLWDGMRSGFLTGPVLNNSASYVIYPSVNLLSQAYPVLSVSTWIPWGSCLRRLLRVPSVWSREATSFCDPLEGQYPAAIRSNTFPCFMGFLHPTMQSLSFLQMLFPATIPVVGARRSPAQ